MGLPHLHHCDKKIKYFTCVKFVARGDHDVICAFELKVCKAQGNGLSSFMLLLSLVAMSGTTPWKSLKL